MNIAANSLDDTVGSAVRLSIICMYRPQQPYNNLVSKFTSFMARDFYVPGTKARVIIQNRSRLGRLVLFRAGPRF